MRNAGIELSFPEIIKLYWIGMFYNQFLPGGVGGDAYKVALLKYKKSVHLRHGAGIMINDRISGFVVLLTLVVLMYYVVQFDSRVDLVLWLLIPLSLFGYLFFLRRFYNSVTKIFPLLMLYSLCVQMMQFIVIIFLMSALGYQEHYLSYLFIFGISSIASNLPISIGGIGIREMVFFTGAQYLNLIPEHAVFISITFYLISFVVSIPGIIWVFHSPFQVRYVD